jgi:DHA3 family macrolide efflux protein-like MFS transporter
MIEMEYMMHAKLDNNMVGSKRWVIPFAVIWGGQAFSLLGSSLVSFALIWWMTTTTGSATVLATAAAMEVLPRVLIGPIAGALVDRLNRRSIMMVADSLVAMATMILVYLTWAGVLQPWHVYTMMLLRAAGGTFHMPAMQASTSLMVPEDQLTRIQGMNQILTGVMNIAGPPLGALLIGLMPMHQVLAIDIVTALLAILPLCFIPIPQPAAQRAAQEGISSLWQDMLTGLTYVFNWAGLRNVLLVAVIINMVITPAVSLIPLLVTERFGGEALDLALMQSSWAVGFLAGGLLLGIWGGFRRKLTTATVGMFGQAVGVLLVGVAPPGAWTVALIGWFVAGLMNVLLNGPAFALLQAVVEPEMQGRVFALAIGLAGAMAPLGLLAAGPAADRLGPGIWLIVAGLVCLAGGVFIATNMAIRQMEDGSASAKEMDRSRKESAASSPA